jgi:hypothetical protein
MSRSEYFALCRRQPIEWLRQCAESPSPYMSKTHVALVRLAVAKVEGK